MTKEEFVEKHCKSCGKERCHGIYSDWFNDCYFKNELDTNTGYNYGWICPCCGKSLAPDVKECSCKPEPKSNINNPFYKTFDNGYCSAGRREFTICPKVPNYGSCQYCVYWAKTVPV